MIDKLEIFQEHLRFYPVLSTFSSQKDKGGARLDFFLQCKDPKELLLFGFFAHYYELTMLFSIILAAFSSQSVSLRKIYQDLFRRTRGFLSIKSLVRSFLSLNSPFWPSCALFQDLFYTKVLLQIFQGAKSPVMAFLGLFMLVRQPSRPLQREGLYAIHVKFAHLLFPIRMPVYHSCDLWTIVPR